MTPEYKEKIREFLVRHPAPRIVVITTIREGCVKCINPVPGLFGPEIHCLADDEREIRGLVTGVKS